jgi:hypothetical protein
MRTDTYNRRILDAIISGKDTTPIASKQLVRSMQSESQIQQACIQWFRYNYPDLWNAGMLYHNANEGIRPGGQGRRIKREGLVKGVADLCLSVPKGGFGALYIEMKKPGGRLSPEQKQWGENAIKYGNKWVVCYSCEEFANIITNYLKSDEHE